MAQVVVHRRLPLAAPRFGLRLPQVGLLLVGLFLLQAAIASLFDLRWEWLAQRQLSDGYAKWTGIGLAMYLGSQWALPVLRMVGKASLARRLYPLHRQAGVAAPALFYLHSMQLGYAFTFVLSVVYLSNVVVGLGSVDVVKNVLPVNRKRYAYIWMVVHIGLSFLTMGLMAYHAFVAFAFK